MEQVYQDQLLMVLLVEIILDTASFQEVFTLSDSDSVVWILWASNLRHSVLSLMQSAKTTTVF